MVKLLLIFSIFLLSSNNLKEVYTIESSFNKFTSNNINGLFLVDLHKIKQYNNKGVFIKEYSNQEHGNISIIDASNPFRILVFYEEFNEIIFLDNKLSEISEYISLNELNISDIKTMCTSATGGFWIFNNTSFQIEKYNNNIQLVQKGSKMSGIIDRNLVPDYICESNNKIYLAFKKKGLYVFDSFGTFEKFIPILYKTNIQIIGNNVFYDNNYILKYNMFSFSTDTLYTDYSEYNGFRIESPRLYLSKKDSIFIYQFSQ